MYSIKIMVNVLYICLMPASYFYFSLVLHLYWLSVTTGSMR